MTNLCPVCQTPIRKNAKFCTLHGARHFLDSFQNPREAQSVRDRRYKTEARYLAKVAAARQSLANRAKLQSLQVKAGHKA